MLNVLASGALTRDPQERTAANGNPYVTAMLRVPVEDGEALFVSLIAFEAQAVEALLALAKGDSVAVAGRAKLSEWTGKDGAEKRGLSVVADRVLTAYQAGKLRKSAREAEEVTA